MYRATPFSQRNYNLYIFPLSCNIKSPNLSLIEVHLEEKKTLRFLSGECADCSLRVYDCWRNESAKRENESAASSANIYACSRSQSTNAAYFIIVRVIDTYMYDYIGEKNGMLRYKRVTYIYSTAAVCAARHCTHSSEGEVK